MSFHNRLNQGPVFSGNTGGITGGAGAGAGGAVAPPPADTAGGAQQAVGGGITAAKQGYTDIFNEQMQQQKELYATITKLNDKKNEQSSFLSLAKSVSEMV